MTLGSLGLAVPVGGSTRPRGRCRVTCNLWRGCRSPDMLPSGEGRRGVLVVAEAPGADEDEQGVQLIGRAGQLLRVELERLGVDLDRDCWKTNAITCRPPDNRTPTAAEIEACRGRLDALIEAKRPVVVLALGKTALEALLSHHGAPIDELATWRGLRGAVVPGRDSWLVVAYHPSYLLRMGAGRGGNDDARTTLTAWRNDLERAFRLASAGTRPRLWTDAAQCVRITMDESAALAEIERARTVRPPHWVTVDYETTGLKPHGAEHRLVCCGLARDIDTAVAFPVLERVRTMRALAELMADPLVPKAAANCRFEEAWTRAKLRTEPSGWYADPVQDAHVLDNRPSITSVKFQSGVRFGAWGYEAGVKSWLVPSAKQKAARGGNAHNGLDARVRGDSAAMALLLTYCAMDALYEHREVHEQQLELNEP